MDNRSSAIGIFDSGVGGLTVVRSIFERLPRERVVYLGDTARVPYGTKSPETIIRYALSCSQLLLERDIKLMIVACNTASACALGHLQRALEIPVIGVVQPGAQAAAATTKTGRVGVIGTPSTLESGEYHRAIQSLDPEIQLFYKACPLFVPLAEEGWTAGPVPERVAAEYLRDLREHGVDTLVLGCTHYPLLTGVIAKAMGDSTVLVDSAKATASVVGDVLGSMDLLAESGPGSGHAFLVSDGPESFAGTGRAFLGRQIDHVEWVDF